MHLQLTGTLLIFKNVHHFKCWDLIQESHEQGTERGAIYHRWKAVSIKIIINFVEGYEPKAALN